MNNKFAIYTSLSLLFLDQLLKLYFRRIHVLFSIKFFSMQLSKNTGALFGLFPHSSLTLAFLALIIVGFMMLYYDELIKLIGAFPFYLVLFGLVSNMIDRFLFGYVFDYFCFSFWPCFNVADAMVVSGVSLFILYALKLSGKHLSSKPLFYKKKSL